MGNKTSQENNNDNNTSSPIGKEPVHPSYQSTRSTAIAKYDTTPHSKNKIERLLQLPINRENKFVLKWYHITNAIKQELYDKISLKFMDLVNSKTRYDNIDELLSTLRKKMNVDENEINYIRELIKRAKTFNPDKRETQSQTASISEFKHDLEADVFGVYNCFLFSNFQFEQCKLDDFEHLFTNKKKLESISKSINLYP
eukprot:260656_1